jgi:N-methylhydantoinase A
LIRLVQAFGETGSTTSAATDRITLSHQVSPEWHEYARTSMAAMDAYVSPVVRRYLNTLMERMADQLPIAGEIHVMESNGGAMSAAVAARTPLQTLLSGPVGGAIGARALAAATERPNLICVDMDGTSFDASLIVDGLPSTSNEAELEGLPIQMSIVDIHVIGAGGGSIAWEEAGAVRVGPKSAGSVPGPACHGRGGVEPTVNDANLVLGRLDGANFAGGTLVLDRDKAAAAVRSIGDKFGLSTEVMAQGILDIINAKMADAIRPITTRRGIDPRGFALLACGGAGPAHSHRARGPARPRRSHRAPVAGGLLRLGHAAHRHSTRLQNDVLRFLGSSLGLDARLGIQSARGRRPRLSRQRGRSG